MTHILDNPIWNALNSGSASFAHGDEKCRFIRTDMGFFAGMPAYDKEKIQQLHGICQPGQRIILFPPDRIAVDTSWNVLNDHELLQMAYTTKAIPEAQESNLTELGNENLPAMLDLVAVTKPGPFLSRTIDFGGYLGIFQGDRLVSMAGKHLCPDPYVEVSAVCTHPDFGGMGFSYQVLQRVIQDINQSGKVPVLHVYPENLPAIKLYTKLGFEPRASLRTYFLEKIG
jgi:predicted GNAT family acetyltransferase